jgi:hypothetical protein
MLHFFGKQNRQKSHAKMFSMFDTISSCDSERGVQKHHKQYFEEIFNPVTFFASDPPTYNGGVRLVFFGGSLPYPLGLCRQMQVQQLQQCVLCITHRPTRSSHKLLSYRGTLKTTKQTSTLCRTHPKSTHPPRFFLCWPVFLIKLPGVRRFLASGVQKNHQKLFETNSPCLTKKCFTKE